MRFSETKHALEALADRHDYAGDLDHENHKEIEISGPFFSMCASAPDFFERITSARERYLEAYPHLPGPKPRLGAEMVLASKGNANLRTHECGALIRTLLSPFPNCPAIYWPHYSRKRARTDFHVLIGNFSLSKTPTYRLHRFGHGRKNYTYYMQRLIEDTIDEINERRWRDNEEPLEYWTDSVLANDLQRGWMPLTIQLFLLGEDLTTNNITAQIEKLGHAVLSGSPRDQQLRVRFKGQISWSCIDLPALLAESRMPVLPRFRYRSRSGKRPPHIIEGQRILDQWRHRIMQIRRIRFVRTLN